MNLKYNHNQLVSLILLFSIMACGDGGGGNDETGDDPTPGINEGTESDLASQAENSFVDSGVDITVSPTYIDFGVTNQDERLTQTFTIQNGTSNSVALSLSFYGTSGGFHILEEEGGTTASVSSLVLAKGESKEFILEFDASIMGARAGYLEILAEGVEGHIKFPFAGEVTGPADFKIISGGYLCSNEDAPLLTKLDFMKAAYGRTATRNLKICNTGGSKIKINSIQFSSGTSGEVSKAMDVDFFSDFEWEVTDALNNAFFDYYNPPQDESFDEPTYIDYTGVRPTAEGAFSAEEHAWQINPDGLVIDSGSYAVIDVHFAPTLDIEAPQGELYNPVSYSAGMEISTSLGEYQVGVVGATGGKEPVLETTYLTEEGTIASLLDLSSDGAAIHFGTANIFEDWIVEDAKEVTLTLANMGSGSKSLKIWADAMDTGYFTFVKESPEHRFPIELAPGEADSITLMYAPTPEGNTADENYDLGQLILRHTSGNGPINPVTLVGEETTAQAVQVYQEVSKLKNVSAQTPYSDTNRKNLCVFQIGGSTDKEFKVVNNSSAYTLDSTWTLSELQLAEGASGSVSASESSGNLSTLANSESTFSISVALTSDVITDTEITGLLSIDNHYDASAESQFGTSPVDYAVYFKAKASETGECTGQGSPLDGQVTLVADRIGMILSGLETARNPAAFKMHVPIDLDKEHGTARIGAMDYDPTDPDPSPVGTFKPYNHQGANVNSCFPLPTNPYKQEFEEGSWDGPAQCAHTSSDGYMNVKGSEACTFANSAQPSVFGDGTTHQVFYHEFVKFDPDTCAPEFEGKVATFHLEPGQSIGDVFQEMEDTYGVSGTENQYQSIEGTFQYDSYIKFTSAYASKVDGGKCNHEAGTELKASAGQADDIENCWNEFKQDESMRRAEGMVEECNYFFFDLEGGCVPSDVPWIDEVDPETVCEDASITYSDPDSWVGFGEYEPSVNPKTGEEDDIKWDVTIRNIHLLGNMVSYSLNDFYPNTGKLIFADLYATLTTKAVGGDINEADWDDLVAVQDRPDYTKEDIFLDMEATTTKTNWLEDGINSELTAGGDDDIDCFDEDGTPRELTPCRGNYLVATGGDKIMTAGEPADFDNMNRILLVGLAAFHGKDQLAPSFAREDPTSGVGKSLVFTIHGCFHEGQGDEVAETAGCYEEHIDKSNNDGEVINGLLQDYLDHGMITEDDKNNAESADLAEQEQSKAYVNFRILDEDRNRYTDYYNYPNNYFYDVDYIVKNCGYGM